MNKISDKNFIDATLESNITKYEENLRELVSRLDSGELNLSLVRNDDFLPDDGVWRVNSKYTCGEYNVGNLSMVIKEVLASRKVLGNLPFMIPGKEKEIFEEMKNIDYRVGAMYLPVKFRSTKHFTVNTPLMYTGDYNAVKADRKYTVIDSASNFLNSGYAYSLSGHDAYLDVAHEGLNISDDAVVLVDEEEYKRVKTEPIFKKYRFVRYKGDLSTAINMILSERGCLPLKPGMGFGYNNETEDKIVSKLKETCLNNGLLYDQSHGSYYGNGHFTDYVDSENSDYYLAYCEFCNYLINKFPTVNFNSIRNRMACYDIINSVNIHRLIEAIRGYNEYSIRRMNETHEYYVEDRKSITPEISLLFKTTLNNIKSYTSVYGNNFSQYLLDSIKGFFYSGSVSEQVGYANEVNEILDSQKEIVRR